MSAAPVIALFNNKGGVGKTSLVYHLAWMYADMGMKTLAADLDPQSNLTAAFLEDDRLEELWPEGDHENTVFGCIDPLLRGTGDIKSNPYLEEIHDRLHLLVGDMTLSRFEDELSQQWPRCLDGQERSFRIISAFSRTIRSGARSISADVILMDLGPNLGAINRAALVAADYLVVPLAPDLFSLQGLKNLGPTIRVWRDEWQARLERRASDDLELPEGQIEPVGYIIMQHAVRLDRPVKAYDRWAGRIPELYVTEVLARNQPKQAGKHHDENCLALIKHYRSLMPMAQEARKPIFHLTSADGAIGSHAYAVQEARRDFERLAKRIAARCRMLSPTG